MCSGGRVNGNSYKGVKGDEDRQNIKDVLVVEHLRASGLEEIEDSGGHEKAMQDWCCC